MRCKDVGRRIADIRKKQNKTQRQLAEELSVTNKAVSKWETGEGYPDIALLPDLSFVLKISIDELLDNNPFKEQAGLEYLERIECRKECQNRINAFKNALCYGFGVILLFIMIPAVYSAISFFRFDSDYWSVAFGDVLAETMLIAIPACFVVTACAYVISRRRQPPRNM